MQRALFQFELAVTKVRQVRIFIMDFKGAVAEGYND